MSTNKTTKVGLHYRAQLEKDMSALPGVLCQWEQALICVVMKDGLHYGQHVIMATWM